MKNETIASPANVRRWNDRPGGWRRTLVARLQSFCRSGFGPAFVPVARKQITFLLSRDQVMRLDDSCGWGRVKVQRGVISLTGTPATHDVLLQPGGQHPLSTGWPFVLQALEEAKVVLLA